MSKVIVALLVSLILCGISSVAESMGFGQIGYTLPVAVGVVIGLIVG
jgi:hypothetical protein